MFHPALINAEIPELAPQRIFERLCFLYGENLANQYMSELELRMK